nr:hypothetical protein OJOKFFHK_00031 [uncultured bacterium]
MHQNEKHAYSFINKGAFQINQLFEKGFQPFKLLWGSSHKVYSLVGQSGNITTVIAKQATDASGQMFDDFELDFELQGEVEVEDKEKSREVILFTDAHEGIDFLVQESRLLHLVWKSL